MNEDWSCLGEDSKDPYSQICTEAVEDEDVFEKFKKDPRYTAILEHVSYEQGKEYAEGILQYDVDAELVDSFKDNDLIGLSIVVVIYLVRSITLFIFSGTFRFSKILPELFLAPRGLLTILLFYAIPKNLIESDINFEGVFLYVIIICSLVMTWVLISEKKKLEIQEEEDFEILDPVDKEEGLAE